MSVSDDALQISDRVFSLDAIERIILVGFGKASGAMAVGFEQALGDLINDGLKVIGRVNVPDDQVVETKTVDVVGCRPPGENLPTPEVLAGTTKIIEYVRSAGEKDVCVCLISGGGSALLEQPVMPITLQQFRVTTSLLSGAGATINELNAVRRVISQVKGGGLARASGGAPIISLILSDVIGDPLDVIASGPTVESESGIRAIDVLNKFDPFRTALPNEIWSVVDSESGNERKNDIKTDVANFVIGNIDIAIQAAQKKAMDLGYVVDAVTVEENEGDAEGVGKKVASQIGLLADVTGNRCQLTGGESTVKLCDDPGQGGRNQHLVLSLISAMISAMRETETNPDIEVCLLSAGTDGEDGNVPVAGAMIDSVHLRQLASLGHAIRDDITKSLLRCDSHAFLSQHGLLFQVPPTFTNVCDLRVLLIRNAKKKNEMPPLGWRKATHLRPISASQ